MLKHKHSKFLFFDFNGYLSEINKPLQVAGHTTTADNSCDFKYFTRLKIAVFYQTNFECF